MEIEIHGYVATIHRMRLEDIKEMITDYLHIDSSQFTRTGFRYLKLKYAFGKARESVSIMCGTEDEFGYYNYLKVNLHGSFFDHSPEFRLEEFIRHISKFGYTPKQLDVAFTDNKNCLSIRDVERWCNERKEYCTGSLVRRASPGIRYTDGVVDRIELSSATSLTNFGTIYIRPDTGHIRIEIKFKDKDKINFLIDDYSIRKIHSFEDRCIRALVGCIDFITPTSKRKRSPDKYIRQQAWKSFLGSDVKQIKWSEKKTELTKNRMTSDSYNCEQSIKQIAGRLQNTIKKLSPIMAEEEILNNISEHCGYVILKVVHSK